MRDPLRTAKLFRLALLRCDGSLDSPLAHARGEKEVLPHLLSEQLAKLFHAIAHEPLPDGFVRLIRQLNEVEDM
jgi:hypothetical protein